MRLSSMALKALVHDRASSIAVIISVTVTSMLITGALLVGESVTATLRAMAHERLGTATHVVRSPEHFMTGAFARRLGGAAVLYRAGSAANGERIAQGRIYGIDASFFGFTRKSTPLPERDTVYVNEVMAARLAVKTGDEIVVRIEKPAALASDVTFGASDEPVVRRRVTVSRVLSADEFGSFSLTADAPPKSALFMDRTELTALIGQSDAADIILLRTNDTRGLERTATAADKGLIVSTNRYGIDVSTSRIFIAPAARDVLLRSGGRPVYGYFVNSIRARTASPYSFAASAPDVAVMRDDGIVLNDWLAADIGASPGDAIYVTYFMLTNRALIERTNRFTVERIVPIKGAADDPSLMPAIPGLAEAASCRTWSPGMPVDLSRIRDKDEDYWRSHRGTPKLFVSPAAAVAMWGNEFGNATAIRFPRDKAREVIAAIDSIPAADAGVLVRDLSLERGGEASTDFASLFLGLSAFVIGAALLLTGLSFSLVIARRAGERAVMEAVGFPPRRILVRMLTEALVLSVSGAVLGALTAIAYDVLLIAMLNAGFSDAAGGTVIRFAISPTMFLTGAVASIAAALVPMAVLVFRRQHVRGVRGNGGGHILFAVAAVSAVLAAVLPIGAAMTGQAAVFFFSAGSMLLLSVLTGIAWSMKRIGRAAVTGRGLFVVRSLARNTMMSMSAIAVIAVGVFMVIAVSASRMDEGSPERRESGTGGFGCIIETAAAAGDDLNAAAVRAKLGLDDALMSNVRFVPISAAPGDDASCRNINRIERARLIGVMAEEFASRKAFRFTAIDPRYTNMPPWSALTHRTGDVINGIADETTLTWGIRKKLGDMIPYTDDRGRTVHVRIIGVIAPSILQGNIITDTRVLTRYFPSASRRIFLVDVPRSVRGDVIRIMAYALRDLGADVISAEERLHSFAAVEHAYLALFLALGGFGLVLGTVAFAALIVRSLAERRGEHAVMRAEGFSPTRIAGMLIAEFTMLLAAGITVGALSAVIAVVPSLASRAVSVLPIVVFLASAVLTGVISIVCAGRGAMRADVLAGLRDE